MTSARRTADFRTVDLAYIALFAVLMAVCAWITILTTIPFTLQTFALFAALTTLGGRRGTYTVLVYLLMGAIGLPVFSGGRGGTGVLLGTTGGYIVGFLFAAITYWLVTTVLGGSLPAVVMACLLAALVCYAFGTAWFLVAYTRTSGPVGVAAALGWCVLHFIPADLAKLGLAVLLSQRIRGFLR